MSIKHLLNDFDDDPYAARRPLVGWDESGAPIDVAPVFQDLSWDNLTTGLLDPDGVSAGFDFATDYYDPNQLSLLDAQGQIEQWAAEHAPSQISSSPTPATEVEERICYGVIYRASVKLRGDMAVLDSRLSSAGTQPVRGHYQMSVAKPDDVYMVTFPDGTALGEVNAQLEKALAGISEQQLKVDLEVFAPIQPIRDTINRATKEKDAVVRVNINIYGSRAAASHVGQELSSHKIFLQQPDYFAPGSIYDNPHMLKLANFQPTFHQHIEDAREEKQPDSEAKKAEDFKKTISKIYSSLTRGQTLTGLEGDARLKTKLLPHQKEALDFMTQRESGPIQEKYRLWMPSEVEGKPCLRHVLTNTISRFEQPETGGGVLADEMGMGKTLSILSLMLRTLEDAHKWPSEDTAQQDTAGHKQRRRTRATLIIASSDLMINEWFQEMDRHFHRRVCEVLRTIKYHGTNRETDPERLSDADLVITTYHTLWSDCQKGKNPLNDIEWYRLVLDEAHIIRRQSTVLYRAVADLRARSRWCLTGTPIQNKLEDIGSLFAFIRVKPFHTLATFRKHISIPFDDRGKRREMAIERFTRLLDSLCLRRTKDLLSLPPQHDRIRHIDFSPEERAQYDQTNKMMWRAAKNQVGAFDQKSTLGMFQIQLQLRILCNHGTYQHLFSWNRRKLHLLDEREAMEASLGRDSEVTCSACKESMPLFGAGSTFTRFTEHCRHVLCSECIQEGMTGCQDGVPASCPLCSSTSWRSHARSVNATYPSEDDKYFRPDGKSSKMEALMDDVRANICSTKSIIFSCWTHTLDLISMYLRKESITHQRIDGECPTSKREKILEEFTTNPALRVLIMTTGTGAVGLNLATANRVFIVEPQWNPSVENQAVARALRLGQEQNVQVTRYVVNNTVEQDMRSLQERKLKMAGMAWE